MTPAGLVTVGVGKMLPDAAAASTLPFVDSKGAPASAAEIASAFAQVHAMRSGMVAARYRYPGSLTLPEPAIADLLRTELLIFDGKLNVAFPKFAGFPAPAKLGLLDMAYNLGVGGLLKYHHLVQSVFVRDWAGAAEQCFRNGPGDARNAWTKTQFMLAARG